MSKQKGSSDQLDDIAGPKRDWPMFENRILNPGF